MGRALDRLFNTNVSQLVLEVIQHVVTEFDLDLSELHNDSTTVRFYGDYEQFDQPQIRRGKKTVAILISLSGSCLKMEPQKMVNFSIMK